jgi:hypothetical protein
MALPLVALLLRGPLAQLHVAAKQWAGQAAGETLVRRMAVPVVLFPARLVTQWVVGVASVAGRPGLRR